MPNAQKTEINEIDQSFNPQAPIKGQYMMAGICVMGPVNDPSALINSWAKFKLMYGDYHPTSDFPLLCKLMLDAGCALRINRIGHYTTIGTKSSLTVTKATVSAFANAIPANLFTIGLKHPGAAYNGATIAVEAATNGQANYFNLRFTFTAQSISELYENLFITGLPTAPNSTYLSDVVKKSQWLTVTYADLSGLSGQQRPVNASKTFASGSDGGSIVATDYAGDSAAKTGIYAFDAFDDCSDISIPEVSDTTVGTALQTYVEGRKDLFGFFHLANTNVTAAALLTDRDATSIISNYIYISAGGDIVIDPITSTNRTISEIAKIFTALAREDAKAGPPQSFSGKSRGKAIGSVGVVNNFGGPGNFGDLNLLANRQVNMLVQEKGLVYLKGNFTGQLTNTKLSYASIRRYLIYLRKQLFDLVDIFQDEPNHYVIWKKMYNKVYPLLVSHRDEYLALYDFKWLGDQDITNMANMVVNNKDDVDAGKYKVKLYIKPVNSIQWISIDVIITPTSVSFENETVIDSI